MLWMQSPIFIIFSISGTNPVLHPVLWRGSKLWTDLELYITENAFAVAGVLKIYDWPAKEANDLGTSLNIDCYTLNF